MSNDVEIVVTGDNRAKPALDSARAGVKGLGDDAKTSSKSTDVLGAALKDVGDKATASLSKSSVGFKALDAEIGKTKTTLGDLRAKFAETGKLALLGDIDQETAKLKTLEGQLKRTFADAVSEIDKTDTRIVNLNRDIDKAKSLLAAMGAEFKKTGNIDMGSFKSLSNGLRDLERAKAAIEKLAPSGGNKNGGLLNFAIDEAVVNGLKSARGAINDAWSSTWKAIENNPVVSTAIIGGVVAGLPIITVLVGTALASAVNLGIGGGVLALGISRAVADTRVADAWHHLATAASDALDKESARFVEPLVRSGHTLEDAFVHDVMPHIGSAFDALAPQIDGLTQGVVGFLHNLGPGFEDATSAARPFIEILSQHLPELGASISSFLSHLNNAGPGAQQFFHDLLTLIESTIRTLGWLVEKGAAVYEEFTALGLLLQGDFKGALEEARYGFHDLVSSGGQGESSFGGFHNKTIDVNTALGLLDGTVSKTTASSGLMTERIADLSKLLDATAVNADTLAGKMTDKLMNSMLGMGHATLGVAESLTSVESTFDQNGRAIDKHTGLVAMNTQAGQSNREAVLSAIEANLRMYDTQIATGVGADVAAQKYGQNTQALHDQLSQAHLTEGQIHDLIGEYGNVPAKVNTEIAMKGLTEAINGLDNLLRQLNGLTYTRTITIDQVTRHIDVGPRPGEVGPYYGGLAHGGISGAAGGGPRSNLTWVGEQGRELVRLPYGSTVIPHGQSERMAGEGGGYDAPGQRGGDDDRSTRVRDVHVNVYPQQGASTAEIVAEVKRELAWSTG